MAATPKLQQALGQDEAPNQKVDLQKFAGIMPEREKGKTRSKPHKVGTICYGQVLGDKTTKIQQNTQARNTCKDQIYNLSQVLSKP